MECIDVVLRDGLALYCCRRCSGEVVIDQQLPFMSQVLTALAGHICEPEQASAAARRSSLRLVAPHQD